MSLIQLAKYSLLDIKQLTHAKKLNFGKTIFYIFLLSLLAAVPLFTQVIGFYSDIQKDGQEITEQLPDFTIENGALVTDVTEGFIYQTDSIIFTFDPEGILSPEDVSNDMVGNFLSMGLLADKLVLALPANEITTALLGSNVLSIPYDNLPGLNNQMLQSILAGEQTPWWAIILVYVTVLFPTFINLIFIVFMAALLANFSNLFRRIPNRLMDNFKVLTFISTIPVLITTAITFFLPGFNANFFIVMCCIILFNQVERRKPPIN